MKVLAVLCAGLLAPPVLAQQAFRCTEKDGKVTYQQSPCPTTTEERKVDVTPANTDYDPAQRARLLKEGEEAGRRLDARTAKEEEDRRRREEQRRLDEQRERETQAREEFRDYPAYVYGGHGAGPRPPVRPPPPRPPDRPTTLPAPQPRPGK